jgi:hypothetical protein
LALALLLFRGAVFGGQALFIRDINMVWYPQVSALVRCIASGSWPLWDPWRGFGQPLLADPSAQVLYPTTWLNLVAPPWASYTAFVVLHLTLGSLGVYALARRWGTSRPAAFVAGGIWMGCGPVLSLTTLWHHFAGASWIPWVLYAADSALESGRPRAALVWGVAAAAQILAGSADMVALTAVSILGLAVSRHVAWRSPTGAANRRLLLSSGTAALVAAGLAAALWMPTVAIAMDSERWGLPAAARETWSLHPVAAAGLLWPLRINRLPLLDVDPSAVHDLQAPWLYSVYMGAGAAVLVAAALAAPGLGHKRYLAGLCGAALLMSLGRYAPFYGVATEVLPPLRMLRFPVKWVILAAVPWALLAGFGADAWAGPGDLTRWRRRVIGTLGLLLAVSLAAALWIAGPGSVDLGALFRPTPPFDWRSEVSGPLTTAVLTGATAFAIGVLLAWVAGRRQRGARAAAVAVMAFGLAELLFAHRSPQPLAPRQLYSWRPPVLRHVPQDDHSRLYVYDYSVRAYTGQELDRPWGYPVARVPSGWSLEAGRALAVHQYLNPPTAERWGIYGSFDLDLLGLYPGPRRELNLLLRRVEGTPAHLRLLQMGAVSRALGLHPDRWWAGLLPVATEEGLFATPIHVLAVTDPLPRAYLVEGVRVADGTAALAAIQDAGFDPRRQVILPAGEPRAALAAPPGTARIERLAPDRVAVSVDARRPGFLVLVDGYDPGWEASVNGRRTAVLRANVAFRAVPVPEGRSDVVFRYAPPSVAAGVALSAATALACLALWWRSRTAAAAARVAPPEGAC